MLKPLHHYVCDTCSDIIQTPEEGWLEWKDGADKNGMRFAHSFRFCHVAGASQRRKVCQTHYRDADVSDSYLSEILPRSPAFIFSFLGVGHLHEPELHRQRVVDMRAFLDVARRLTIPHYEEARQFWADAEHDGMFEGRHEYSTYAPDFLISIIERYGPYGGGPGPKVVPVSGEVLVFAERLISLFANHDSARAAPSHLVKDVKVLGEEIFGKLGDKGMRDVFDAAEASLTESARNLIDRTWSGTGYWIA